MDITVNETALAKTRACRDFGEMPTSATIARRAMPVKKIDRLLPQVLNETFGLTELREGQEAVMKAVLARKNALAVMPTGAGKSLCYQVPAVLLPGTTLVISPLISLMKDQREKIEDLDLEAHELNSSIADSAQSESLNRLRKGKAEFVYVTPERLTDPEFIKTLKKIEIDLVVIDEAHCITQWGHDFRPSYLTLRDAIEKLGHPPVLALTATATREVIDDIQKQLGLKQLEVFYTGVMRPNLHYEAFVAEDEAEKLERLLEAIRKAQGSTIIYSATVKSTEFLKAYLVEHGIPALSYHGKMRAKERSQAQDAFMSQSGAVMVATSAFGLGIDKPDVRAVIHYNFPGSLEAYYQESGRAGRDGEWARCTLLYLKKDRSIQSFFLAGKYPRPEEIDAISTILSRYPRDRALELGELSAAVKGISKKKLSVVMTALQSAGALRRTARETFEILEELSEQRILEISQAYEAKQKGSEDKLKQMIIYSQTALCRWRMILNYFGEAPDVNTDVNTDVNSDVKSAQHTCGHCDNCQNA